MRFRWIVGGTICIFAGIFLIIFGISFKWFIFPAVLETAIYKSVKLTEGTGMWDAFLETPVPVYLNFYWFHVLNPEETLAGGRPEIMEVGPWAFKEIRGKEDVIELGNSYVRYASNNVYIYDQEVTDSQNCIPPPGTGSNKCSPDDNIKVLNFLLGLVMGIIPKSEDLPVVARPILNNFLDNYNLALNGEAVDCGSECEDSILMDQTLMDLLFNGFESGALKSLQWALDNTDSLDSLLEKVDFDTSNIPTKISLFGSSNGTTGGYYRINNGIYDHHKIFDIDEYNGLTELPVEWWPKVPSTPAALEKGQRGKCGYLGGTDGSQFTPFLKKEDNLTLYVSELCRTVVINFEKKTKYKGIDVLQYRTSDNTFDMHDPSNYCYCPEFEDGCAVAMEDKNEWDFSGCENKCKDGLVRVTNCYSGFPVVMSAPHFLRGDESLIKAFKGLNPNKELHDTILNIEPNSGAPLSTNKRIMANIEIESNDRIDSLNNIRENIFPLVWFDEWSILDEETEKDVKDAFSIFTTVDIVSIGVGIVFGVILIGLGILLCVIGSRGNYEIIMESSSNEKVLGKDEYI